MGIDTAGQPSWRRFRARYSGAGASIVGVECLAGQTGMVLSGVHVMDIDDFPWYVDTYNRLRSIVFEFDDLGSLREIARRNGGSSSLSEKNSLWFILNIFLNQMFNLLKFIFIIKEVI